MIDCLHQVLVHYVDNGAKPFTCNGYMVTFKNEGGIVGDMSTGNYVVYLTPLHKKDSDGVKVCPQTMHIGIEDGYALGENESITSVKVVQKSSEAGLDCEVPDGN